MSLQTRPQSKNQDVRTKSEIQYEMIKQEHGKKGREKISPSAEVYLDAK